MAPCGAAIDLLLLCGSGRASCSDAWLVTLFFPNNWQDQSSIGLHKEPSKFPGIDRIEVHVRRQLWWSLVSLDTQIAMAAGLPAIIIPKHFDVEPAEELSESAISSPPVEGSATIKEILRTFICGKYAFYGRMGEFVHLLHSNFLSEADLDKLLDIVKNNQVSLQRSNGIQNRDNGSVSVVNPRLICDAHREQLDQYTRRDRIALAVKGSMNNGQPASGSAVFSKFTKMVISMMAAKPFAVMYGPVRRHGLLAKLKEKEPT